LKLESSTSASLDFADASIESPIASGFAFEKMEARSLSTAVEFCIATGFLAANPGLRNVSGGPAYVEPAGL
jgi:hypothetical protein